MVSEWFFHLTVRLYVALACMRPSGSLPIVVTLCVCAIVQSEETLRYPIEAGDTSLQSSFLKYRQQKMLGAVRTKPSGRSAEAKAALRAKFIERARSYIGVVRYCERGGCCSLWQGQGG